MRPPSWPVASSIICAHQRLLCALQRPVSGVTLGLFRLALGLLLALQSVKFGSLFNEFLTSTGVFPYAGFKFVPALPMRVGEVFLRVNFSAALLLAAGVYPRACASVYYVTFAWMFHICESNHNNHYILICHIAFCAIFLDTGKWFSLQRLCGFRRRRGQAGGAEGTRVAYWNLLIAQMLFVVPYFWGGVAKINYDWCVQAVRVCSLGKWLPVFVCVFFF